MQNNEIINMLKLMDNSGIKEFLQNHPRIFYDVRNNNIAENVLDLNNIRTLEELEFAINNLNTCDLKKTAKNTVFSDGDKNAKVMLIGEAPGADEDIEGKPFVGQAGKLLNKMLNSIDLKRGDVYITNIVPWRPPNNRQPTKEEIIICLPFVQKHIELINPDILILLGGIASKALLMSDLGIMKLKGKWYEYNSYGLANPIMTRPIFHPAFLLRSPSYKKEVWKDLIEIKNKLNIK